MPVDYSKWVCTSSLESLSRKLFTRSLIIFLSHLPLLYSLGLSLLLVLCIEPLNLLYLVPLGHGN